MGGSKKKRPFASVTPQVAKVPTELPGDNALPPTFHFAKFDKHLWVDGDERGCPASFHEVASFLSGYETMSWAKIIANKTRDHAIHTYKLSSEAKKRLQDLNQDDVDKLWRFRFTGRQRIWGVRQGNCFMVLWWDPHHQIYPYELPNT